MIFLQLAFLNGRSKMGAAILFGLIFLINPQLKSDQPNILFILADDLGYGDLGCYGRVDIHTPHLDRLAASGVRFTAHYANGPECTPTRTALMTGRYPQRIGGLECAIGTGNVGRYPDAVKLRERHELGLPPEENFLLKGLKHAGYRTAITGKWHLGYEPHFAPHLQGFDETFYCVGGGMDYFHYTDTVDEYNLFEDGKPVKTEGYFTDLLTDRAVSFLKRDHDRPFFLYIPFTVPHAPFQGPEDWTPDPIPTGGDLWNQSKGPKPIYRAMIEHMDLSVGRILATLESAGLDKNTLVIFAGDNGGTKSGSNTPFSGFKGGTFEGGIRVPAFARWPGKIQPGTISYQPCITTDWTASILKLTGWNAPAEKALDGMDIISHVVDRKPDQERELFWRKPRGETVWQGLRKGDWKYIREIKGDQSESYLFHLENDPQETTNLKASMPERFKELQSKYEAWEQTSRKNRRK